MQAHLPQLVHEFVELGVVRPVDVVRYLCMAHIARKNRSREEARVSAEHVVLADLSVQRKHQ